MDFQNPFLHSLPISLYLDSSDSCHVFIFNNSNGRALKCLFGHFFQVLHWWFSQRWRSGTNRERAVLFISPACPSSLASLAGALSAETSLQRSFSLNQHPLPPEQLQPSRTPCAVIALCHSAVPGDSKSHHLCSPLQPHAVLLQQLIHHCLPSCPIPCWKPLGRRFSTEPPVLLEGRCLQSTCSAILKAFIQMSDCFCFC